MNVLLWVLQGVLAAMFLMAGGMKLAKGKSLQQDEKMAENMGWMDLFSDGQVRAIGGAELLGGVGIVLPAVVDIAPILVPIAAVGLTLDMLGAASVHARRSESQQVMMTLVLAALAAFVAWGRFGPESFA